MKANFIHQCFLALSLFLSSSVFAQNAGHIDSTFWGAQTTSAGFNNAARSVHLLSNGKIFVGGHFTQYFGISTPRMALLDTNGYLDTAFTINSLGAGGANHDVRAAYVDTFDIIYIGGIFTSVNGFSKNRLARLNPNGVLDSAFNSGPGPNNEVTKIVANGGRILIAGFFSTYDGTPAQNFAVLNHFGNIDPTFTLPGPINNVRDFHLFPNNSMILVGAFTSPANRIIKLNANGTIDASFNSGTGANNVITSIRVQDNGKIMITGSFTSYNGTPVGGIARLNPDGSIDPTFSSVPGFTLGSGSHISVQSDGKYVISGTSSLGTYNGTPIDFLVRLNNNGSLDATLDLGSGFNGNTNMTAIQPNGKILVAGGFMEYRGQIHRRLVRLMNNIGATPPPPAPSSVFAEFDFIIDNAPLGSPDSLLILVDTFPLTPSQPAFSFYIPKVTANSYYINHREQVYTSFLGSNLDVQVTYPCGSGTATFISSHRLVNVNMSGSTVIDTTVYFADTISFCQPPASSIEWDIFVFGKTNSAGSIDPVNNFTYLLLLSKNNSGTIAVVDSLNPSTLANDSRIFTINDTTLEYSVLAIPDFQHAFLFSNNLPTFFGNVTGWQSAAWRSFGVSAVDTINLVSTQPGNGNGSGSGNVNSGSPRNTNTDPVEGLLMIIADAQGNIVGFDFTDAQGDYQISNLNDGNFQLWGESLNRVSDTVNFSISASGTQQFTDLDFEKTDTRIIFQGILVSVEDFSSKNLRMFPNPTRDVVTLDITHLPGSEYMLEILSSSGVTIERRNIQSDTPSRIDMQNYASGMYIIRLLNLNSYESYTSRIIKL